jgi:hypothetical protein
VKIVRNVRMQDSPGDFRGRTRDEIASTQPNAKRVALGLTSGSWPDLKLKIDTFVDESSTIVRGFLANHVVGAEGAPGGLNLGTTAADLEREILEAAEPSGRPADVDVGEILSEVRRFRQSVGSPVTQNEMRDALVRLRAARDAIDAQVRSRGTGDSWGTNLLAQDGVRNRNFAASWNATCREKYDGAAPATPTRDSSHGTRGALQRQIQGGASSSGTMRNRRYGDFSQPISNAERNRIAREFYAKKA